MLVKSPREINVLAGDLTAIVPKFRCQKLEPGSGRITRYTDKASSIGTGAEPAL